MGGFLSGAPLDRVLPPCCASFPAVLRRQGLYRWLYAYKYFVLCALFIWQLGLLRASSNRGPFNPSPGEVLLFFL